MIITGEQIIAEARRWIGTPFQHLGRELGTGVDCLGLILGVASELGLYELDYSNYSRVPGLRYGDRSIIEMLTREAEKIATPEPGAIAFIHRLSIPHFAFLDGDGRMVHAHAGVGRVVETSYDSRWTKRTRCLARIRGVVQWPR